MKFENKIAVVTGAAAGIGRATAMRFAEEGAVVAILDLNEEGIKRVAEELSGSVGEVIPYVCDISDEARVNEVFADIISRFGRVDILVNNAALWKWHSPFMDIPVDVWKKFMDVNLMGTVYCTRAALPSMLAQEWGRIINVASVAGEFGISSMAQYSASKGAVIAMTKALAKEVVTKGVLVNAIAPGSVSPGENPDIDYYKETGLSFMGRTGTDRENANLIAFLASDEASYISGTSIRIDGCRKTL